MKDKLEGLKLEALEGIKNARTRDEVLDMKVRYLGRKGMVASLLKDMASYDPSERKNAGELINSLKHAIEKEVERQIEGFDAKERKERLAKEGIDVTLPGRTMPIGKVHPISRVMQEIEDVFTGLGFDIAEGPEIEDDYHNFEALNIPKGHPARDMQDTFYLVGDLLLRTHTSPVQIRVMEETRPPLRVIAPGAVYRRDSDITHTPMFHQVEGFMVDEDIRFSDLKGVLTLFLKHLFGENTPVRFRPSFFPFTEPSAEVDIGCVMCNGKGLSNPKGCRVCKNSGWLEILGSGMIHPQVFRSVGYDPQSCTGFAFGLGVERIAMLKYGIDDIRLFFENDLRFLRQF
ncbi:MAG: phenylalanine--tRNA ligase subunit alpha [Deltaproteobacteria bacterium]|nr:phenylalanine--tRNA ligase subunit alpha [Deltaproteobacteria bacterium]